MDPRWLLCFLLPLTASAQEPNGPNKELALLQGTVVHAATNEPLRKAEVILESQEGASSVTLVAITDGSGQFRFASVKAGLYYLKAQKYEFLNGAYGGDRPDSQGSLLKVAPGDRLENLTLKLFPAGVISGQVVDGDGDPIPNNTVALWRLDHISGQPRKSRAGQTDTDHTGTYRFGQLSPGTYYVGASAGNCCNEGRKVRVNGSGAATKLHDLPTFYPTALSLTDSQGLTIQSGDERSGIDIRIQRGPSVSVKGRIVGLGNSVSAYNLSSINDDGTDSAETGTISQNGDFLFEQMPPGKHQLWLADHGPNGFRLVGKTEVIVADQNVIGVVITPYRPAQVRVRAVVEGEEDKPLIAAGVFLRPTEPAETSRSGQMTFLRPQNGVYAADQIAPGRYALQFRKTSECYLKSLRSGQTVLDDEAIDVGEGAALNLVATFSRNVASLTGDVAISQNPTPTPVHVFLFKRSSEKFSLNSQPEIDQTLHFSAPRLAPGRYALVAAEEDSFELWSNPDFVNLLQSESTEVELHEKEQRAVHLKLISKEQTDRARKTLGL